MDAVASPLLSTTNQPDLRIFPLITDSEFWQECRHSLREEWILFFSLPVAGAGAGMAKPRKFRIRKLRLMTPPALFVQVTSDQTDSTWVIQESIDSPGSRGW